MACSDRLALRILDACRRARLNVPEEVAVIGVDNDEETCRLANSPLSSVMDDPRRIGREAAALLDRLMRKGWEKSAGPILVPPLGVVARRSTDSTAVEDPLLSRAAHLIRSRSCQGLTVKELVSELRVSPTTLYKRFHAIFGVQPHQKILSIKLDQVKSLLKMTTCTMEEIAERTGFENADYMQVAFKREVGTSPGNFRRQNMVGRTKAK